MAVFTPKEELIGRLHGEDIGCFPRSIPVFTPVVEMMKITGTRFPEANYRPGPMAKLALAAHELAHWNCTMLPWASTVEMEALGCEVANRDDDIAAYPQFKARAFDDAYSVTFRGDILNKGSFPAVFEATKIVRDVMEAEYDGAIPVVSMFQGPFTVASYTIGVNEMYRHVIRDEKRARKVLDTVSDLSILYAERMLQSGGDVILMSDPTAEGLTGEQFQNILLPVYRKIADALDSAKMIHICGRTGKIASHLPDAGFHGFSFDFPGVSLETLREKISGRMRLIGSVPTVTHLLEGTRDDVMGMAREMIDDGTDFLSPSCGLPQYTPLDNVKALADAVDQWNNRGDTTG
jgi:MtaA/CmuA family methyltransferase